MKIINSAAKKAPLTLHSNDSLNKEYFFGAAIRKVCRNRLSVINYHRIIDPENLNTNSDHTLVSASTAQFAEQMEFVGRYFNVISNDQLLDWLSGDDILPDFPLLITFDDGYLDNYQFALPILKQHNFPAILFVASDCIESTQPFYWDLMAYCFNHTQKTQLKLPLLDHYAWSNEAQRNQQKRQLQLDLKQLPEIKKLQIVEQLPDVLDVAVPADAFTSLYLNWDQVRALKDSNVAIGGHTKSHPILSKISLTEARLEVADSKALIESELDQPLRAFAYPNGQYNDFNKDLESLLKEVGFEAAFSLIPGPTSFYEVKQNSYAIRRIYMNQKDSLTRFTAKLIGASRLLYRKH